ncbi:MAG: FimB/Mfa2 family fimbrial subunit [Bacteroides sp.]|nr:FimB/Mfa2 family fimbrial subunit [Bacteroides sp.]
MKFYLKPITYLFLLSGLLLTGCIKGSDDDCPDPAPPVPPTEDPQRMLMITVRDVLTSEDITSVQQLDNVYLYLFNSHGELYQTYQRPVDDVRNSVALDITDTGLTEGYVTVWSNLSDLVTIAESQTRSHISHLTLHLSENPNTRGFLMCPGDLFFGYTAFNFDADTRAEVQTRYIDVARKNARLHITVKGLEYREDPEEYYFKISPLYDGYDFTGLPLGKEFNTREMGIFNTDYDFVSPEPYLMIHAEKGRTYTDDACVHIHLMHTADDQEMAVAIKDTEGNYLHFESGKTTNVLIVLGENGALEVRTEVTDWDEIYQWTIW